MDQLEQKLIVTKRSMTYTYYTSLSSDTTPVPQEEKPALLFCHGFPDSSFLWHDVLIKLNEHGLLAECKVIVPDIYADMADDLCNILDAEDVNKITIIGHDWGAAMAQRFYPFHSDRAESIILLNVAYHSPSKPGDPRFDLQAANQMLETAFGVPLWTYWDFFTSEDGPRLMQENLQKAYITGNESVPLKPYAEEQRWKDAFFGQFRRHGFEAPVQWYKAMIENVQYEVELYIPLEKHTIEVPVLFVGCTQDGNNRVEFIEIPQKAGLLPKLTVRQLDCGHWSPMERPAEVAGYIAEFLQSG